MSDSSFSLLERIRHVFSFQNVRPYEVKFFVEYIRLDLQFGFRFELDSDLSLIVERTIEAAIIQIYFHIDSSYLIH